MKNVIYNRYPIGNKRFNWKQKEFILSTFSCAPHLDHADGDIGEVIDKCVKHLKEAGFNMLELGWAGHVGAWSAVDACEKHEIDLLFQDISILGGMQHHCIDNKVSRDVVKGVVDQLKSKKHVVGYYVWDEPRNEEQFTEARRQMNMLEEEDPEALLFTVAIPSCNGAFFWENGLYAPYVEQFIKEMEPPVLSFDYYPIGDYFNAWLDHTFIRENQLDDTFMWLDLALHRKLAKDNNLPLWFYYQGIPLFECTDYFVFPMVRCMMYGAILYGVKGLQHYSAVEKYNYLLKPNGEKDIFFEDQKKIHAEIKALGNTLMALESKKVYHSAELLPGCEYLEPLVDRIEDSNILAGELPYRTSVGELEDAYGNLYVMILNRDYEKTLDTVFSLKEAFRIYEVSREDGKQSVIHEETTELPIKLEPGDAVLLRVQKADEEAFTVEYRLKEKV